MNKWSYSQAEILSVKKFLSKKVFNGLNHAQKHWLIDRLSKVRKGNFNDIYFAFSSVSTIIEDTQFLDPTDEEKLEASILRRGWTLSSWKIQEAARILILMESYTGNDENFANCVRNIYGTADLGEQLAILKGLPVIPAQEAFTDIAQNGGRSSVTDLFESIALNNPFAHDYFSENEWNQMVLKALFIDSCLNEIYGLDRRCNANLTRMAIDLLHERNAAGRLLNPEAWRIISPFLNHEHLSDIRAIVDKDFPEVHKKAVALACVNSRVNEANNMIVEKLPDIYSIIINTGLSWLDIAREWKQSKYEIK